jgi:hypothetical protein
MNILILMQLLDEVRGDRVDGDAFLEFDHRIAAFDLKTHVKL